MLLVVDFNCISFGEILFVKIDSGVYELLLDSALKINMLSKLHYQTA